MIGHCMFGCKPCNCDSIGTHWDLHCKGNPESRMDENTLEVEGKGVEFCKHGVLDGKKLCYRCSDD